MTDAEKAYQIAEQRIERARVEGLKYLNLSPYGFESDGAKWEAEEALEHLAVIPPSLSTLTEITRLDLDGTQVADLTPLAGLVGMHLLHLNSTSADLSALVAPGAVWQWEDLELDDLEFKNVAVDDEALAEIGTRSGKRNVGAETLARLRELRDMAALPDAPQDRDDGARLDLDEHGVLGLADPAIGNDAQDDLTEELQDACAALAAALATSNQFAHTRGRTERLMRLLAAPLAETGAERAWALVNALRDDHEGHQAASKANDAGEIGAAEAMLAPAAAPKLATAARIAGVWLMGFPGIAAVEQKYAEYETGQRVEKSVEDAETLLTNVLRDMTDDAATFADDLLAAAKHPTRAGGRAAKAIGAFA